jgi:hypothetical protein
VPFGKDVVVTVGAGLIVMLRALVALEPALAAFTVKFEETAAEGVPLIKPPLDSVSPAGSAPAVTLHV